MNQDINFSSILSYASNGEFELAKISFSRMIHCAAQMEDVDLSRQYLLSVHNLIRYLVLGSPDFLPTSQLLSMQNVLEQELSHAATSEEALRITFSFFPGYFQELQKSSIRHLTSRLSGRVIQRIRRHYASDLSVEEIALGLGLPHSTMCNTFKRETGVTVHKMLSRIRLTIAAEKLLNHMDQESKIASDVGYRDIQAFRKAFRLYFGATPYQYRKARGQIATSSRCLTA